MKRINKSKKGFTLVELMTAIAIICLIMGLFVSLVIAVKDSFYRTYTSNDAADYAYLYATAVENYILKCAESDPGTAHTFAIDADNGSVFLVDGTEAFTLSQMTKEDGTVKWNVYLDAVDKGNGLIEYKLYFVDNYINPGELSYTYEGSFWIPCHTVGSTPTQPGAAISITHDDGSAVSWNGYGGQVNNNTSAKITVTGAHMVIPGT